MAPRVETHRLRELVRLHRLERSGRELARLLRMGPNTVRRYRDLLARAGLLAGPLDQLPALDELSSVVTAALPARAPRPASVEPWRPRIEALVAKGLGARATFDRLGAETKGTATPLGASYSAVKRAVRALKRDAQLADAVAIPVDTGAGEVAQVDFGYAGKLYDPTRGVLRRAWCFVMTLGFSRLMFVRLVFDQTIETWLDLHEQAFRELNGVVVTVVPDNNRRAVLRAAFAIDGPCELNRSYRELAQRYGFVIDPAPPGQPRKRGKAEAAVKYLKNNPLKARDGESLPDVQAALAHWNRDVASLRVHGTTRRRPLDLFNEVERAALRPLPAEQPEPAIWKKARVHPDVHVAFRDRLYSVPWQLTHAVVWLRAAGSVVEVFHDDRLVATHRRHGPRRSTIEDHLPPDRRDLRHRGRAFWEERARRLGPDAAALVREVFDSDDVLSRLRQVQATVRLLEAHATRAEAVCRLARQAGDPTYQGVKRILALAADRGHGPDRQRGNSTSTLFPGRVPCGPIE